MNFTWHHVTSDVQIVPKWSIFPRKNVPNYFRTWTGNCEVLFRQLHGLGTIIYHNNVGFGKVHFHLEKEKTRRNSNLQVINASFSDYQPPCSIPDLSTDISHIPPPSLGFWIMSEQHNPRTSILLMCFFLFLSRGIGFSDFLWCNASKSFSRSNYVSSRQARGCLIFDTQLGRHSRCIIITPLKIMYNMPPEKVAVQQEDGLSSSPSIFQEICFRRRLLTFILPCLGRQLSFQFKGPE